MEDISLRSNKYDIVIRGAYGAENFGDDALLHSLIRNLSSGKKIAVIGKKNGYVGKLFNNIDFYTYEDNIKLDTQVLLWGGGTQFYDFFSTKFLFRKIYTLISKPNNIINKIMKIKVGPQVNYEKEIYFCVGFGPFASRKKKKITANRISKADLIYVRDNDSYSSLIEYSKSIYKTEDICLLDRTYYSCKTVKNNKICIILRDWYYDNSSHYIEKIIEFYKNNKNILEIDFILFGKDPDCVKKLNNEGIKYIQWDASVYSIYEFSRKISEYNLIISARYHGIIFSLIHDIPSIAIEIEPKLKIVSEEYNRNVFLWEKPFNENALNILIQQASSISLDKSEEKFDTMKLKCMLHKIEASFSE